MAANKPKTLRDLGSAAGDSADLELVAAAINHFGEGDHPWADPATVLDFAVPYAIQCLTRGAHQPGPDAAAAAELAVRYRAAFRKTSGPRGAAARPFERRAAGTARYFKLAVWDASNLTWRDGKRAFPSEPAARAAARQPGRYRVSCVDDGHRTDGEPFDVG